MTDLLVFADFHFLRKTELVGMLSYERLRGSDVYRFEFTLEWLKEKGDLFLCEDLHNFPGPQFTNPDKDIFGCFSDVLPDRWGRTLLNRREQMLAREENRSIRRLSSFDYLTGIDDLSRMGALRFKETTDGDFINMDNHLRIPPLTEIRQLETACRIVEKSEETDTLPEKKWLAQLLNPGSSLGGARPKASVIGPDSTLYIAKFPSINDDYDVCLWEHFCHLLARRAGINAAHTRVMQTDGRHHTLLSKRFDRTDQGRRVHFASSMALLGLSDGDGATTGHGYLDIVDFILQHCTYVRENLRELFRRVAFNIAVGNTDDHFRNHGFLLTPKGWTLSPAYDMNPTNGTHQSLLISDSSNLADTGILLDACEQYMLQSDEAEAIITEVRTALRSWRELAATLHIPQREISLFERRIM